MRGCEGGCDWRHWSWEDVHREAADRECVRPVCFLDALFLLHAEEGLRQDSVDLGHRWPGEVQSARSSILQERARRRAYIRLDEERNVIIFTVLA